MLTFIFYFFALPSLALAWQSFIVPHTDGQDDIPNLALTLAAGNYTSNATILFTRGITYNIFTPIKFPILNNVEIVIEGNLTLPADIPTVQGNRSTSAHRAITDHQILPQLP